MTQENDFTLKERKVINGYKKLLKEGWDISNNYETMGYEKAVNMVFGKEKASSLFNMAKLEIQQKEETEEVFVGWAVMNDRQMKAQINREIYEEIKDKAELKFIENKSTNEKRYFLINDNPENLSDDKLALIADNGSLCFGYERNDNILLIYTC
jgi:ribosomal silencing factor RsfS